MKPLLAYAFLKSVRERFLWPLLFAAAVFLIAPIVAVSVEAAATRNPWYPFLFPTMSAAETSVILTRALACLSAVTAAAGAFWVYRTDIADRSLSFLLMAMPHPLIVCGSAVIFGWCLAMTSFAIGTPIVIGALGGVPHAFASTVLTAALLSVLNASTGCLFAVLSPAPGNVVNLIGVSLAAAALLSILPAVVMISCVTVASVLALALASAKVEARCAG